MLVLRKNKKKVDDRWKADGQQKFQAFNSAFNSVNRHLKPFHYKKEFLTELLEVASLSASELGCKNIWNHSRQLLEKLNPLTKWAKNKSE